MSEKNNHISRESSLRRKKTGGSYHYRRRSKALFTEQHTAELKHVLGLTLKTNCSFSCNPHCGLLAYPAGCVIILYKPAQNKQTHIFNPVQKTLTCLQFSNDGNFIVTGEAGHQPCVRVFSVHDGCQIVAFSSHKFGISCVAFSPNGKHVISIGFQHDNVINVWDWKKSKLAASNKVSTKIKSIAFAEDSSHFITAGNRHVKYWYLEEPSADKITIPLKGRSAILESLRNHVFCDVVCGVGGDSRYAFAVTRSGILCQFNAKRTVEKYVELKCGNARSICSVNGMIFCGCGNGSVQIFSSTSLEFIREIVPVEQLRSTEIIAIAVDMSNMWLHCVLDDRSFVVCDIMDLSSPHVHSLFRFHKTCVWDVKTLPWATKCESLPKQSFVTCSNDGTARAWLYDGEQCNLLKVIKLDGERIESSAKFEARSMAIRSDGTHLAVGDRSGNIHIYDLESFERIGFIPTHEGDVLCLDYSHNEHTLASASRDRCVHTFDASYNPTHTVADHSASVTSVKLAQLENEFRLITCGADKSLYFCSISSDNAKTEISREQHFVERHSMSDMTVLEETVLVACGCNLSEYDIIGGKLRRTFRGNDASSVILKVAVNSHRTLVATSCADKNIYILGFTTGDCQCVLSGHSEVAVAVTFDAENRLLSASADGCVFVWSFTRRVSDDLKNLQSNASNPSSAVTTPNSSDLDRTAYFAEPPPNLNQTDQNDKMAAVNGESNVALSTDSELNEEMKIEPFKADCATVVPDPTIPELPTWVTKAIPSDTDSLSGQTPRMPLGKWGHRLEAEKICEEIGNLPVSVDVSSIRSSIDGDDTCLDETQYSTANDASKEILSEVATPINDSERLNSGDRTLTNEPRDLGSQSDDSDCTTPRPHEPIAEERSCETPSSTNDQVLVPLHTDLNEETLPGFAPSMEETIAESVDEADVTVRSGNLKSISEEMRDIANQQIGCEKSHDTSENPATLQANSVQTDTFPTPHLPQSGSRLSDTTENFPCDAEVSEEDIDMRRVVYGNHNKNDQEHSFVNSLKSKANLRQLRGEHEMHSTPKSHYTVSANIKLSPVRNAPSKLIKSVSEESMTVRESSTQDEEVRRSSSAAVDAASKTLVNRVLASIDDYDVIEANDVIEQSRVTTKQPATKHQTSSAARHCTCKEGSEESLLANVKDDVCNSQSQKCNDTDQGERAVTEKPEMQVPPSTIDSAKPSRRKTRSNNSKEKSTAMPPAFAEFLASLTKKKSPRTSTSSNSLPKNQFQSEPPVTSSVDRRTWPHDKLRSTDSRVGRTADANRVNGDLSGISPRPDDSHPQSHSNIDECQKACDDLMDAFNYAERLYQRQKTRHNRERLSNGSLVGLNTLSRTFQNLYGRLSQLNTVSDSAYPDPKNGQLSSRSLSLNNLASDESVYTLLREYSDKLVGLVNNQMDDRLLSTPTDTV